MKCFIVVVFFIVSCAWYVCVVWWWVRHCLFGEICILNIKYFWQMKELMSHMLWMKPTLPFKQWLLSNHIFRFFSFVVFICWFNLCSYRKWNIRKYNCIEYIVDQVIYIRKYDIELISITNNRKTFSFSFSFRPETIVQIQPSINTNERIMFIYKWLCNCGRKYIWYH